MRVPVAFGGVLLALLAAVLPATRSIAQGSVPTLFAEPLHLTREVSDPISGTTSKVEEYCVGNRVISIRDSRTSIADYERGELTEIDRAKGTYSVTTFDAIARALPDAPRGAARKSGGQSAPELTDLGVRSVGTRGGRAFEARIEEAEGSHKVEVVVDQQIKVSREALEVLVGAAFPLQRTAETEIAIAAAGRDRAGAKTGSGFVGGHALPLEQTVTWEVEGDTLRVTNRIVRVGGELPLPELIAIPPGAQLVESEIVLRRKVLDELDRLPSASPTPNP